MKLLNFNDVIAKYLTPAEIAEVETKVPKKCVVCGSHHGVRREDYHNLPLCLKCYADVLRRQPFNIA